MSWDILLFHTTQSIESVEELDEEQLQPFDFSAALEDHFPSITRTDNHRSINDENFSIEYFADNETAGVQLLSLYGEQALFELILLAKRHGWQIYDTGMGSMIDLENPAKNGYEQFQYYLQQISWQIKQRE